MQLEEGVLSKSALKSRRCHFSDTLAKNHDDRPLAVMFAQLIDWKKTMSPFTPGRTHIN